LIVVPCFFHSSQHSLFGHGVQILPFLLVCDQRVYASNYLLVVASDQVSASRMAYQGVKIVQDFHETVAWSYGLYHNFPCKSNKHYFNTILQIIWGMCSMLIADQINLCLIFLHCNRGELVTSWCVH
jgi:hypothetical protein